MVGERLQARRAVGVAAMTALTVYVAGAYSAPDDAAIRRNVERALDAGDAVEDMGLVAFVPHLAHWRDARRRRSYQHWMFVDRIWLARCDALLRLPGPSKGADDEVQEATRLGIPVFTELAALHEWASAKLAVVGEEP